jgi:hypothetical protein
LNPPFNAAPAEQRSSRGRGNAAGMSLLNRMYYSLKPLLPVATRYALRRLRAQIKLASIKDWPIQESAAKTPAQWPGWPGGKKFAVVLTHDVEGQIGVTRSAALAALERRHGFRSSFNFVPEGDYRVTGALRKDLVADGFEVGVHDLRHDGTLFHTRAKFSAAAQRINHYLGEWEASGFRAGFMFHNLEWIKELNIEYDASTFDVDPFEAQPDGVGTIFPFWVPRSDGSGYVELPYTLAQDSTMFLILRERTIRKWKTKVDWIAQNGGMVLLNLHPDYVAFGSESNKTNEFPEDLYAELLRYIRDAYPNAYWQALPREVARFYKETMVGAN